MNSVVQANLDLLGKEAKITAMATVLAREAYFGVEVMSQCTAQGYGDKPGLPVAELMALKVSGEYKSSMQENTIEESKEE